jgi:translation initiation factor IF-3
VEELGFVESTPRQDGRNMTMVIGPHRKKAEARAEVREERARVVADRRAERKAERADRAPAATVAKPRKRSENIDADMDPEA